METLSCFEIKTYCRLKSTQATIDENLPTFFAASLFFFFITFLFLHQGVPSSGKTNKEINK